MHVPTVCALAAPGCTMVLDLEPRLCVGDHECSLDDSQVCVQGICQSATPEGTEHPTTTGSTTSTSSDTEASGASTGSAKDPEGTTGTSASSDEDEGSSAGSDTTSTGDAGSSESADPGPQCPRDVRIEPVIPTIVLLVDQSLSMRDPFMDSTRWETLKNVLMNPEDGVVANLQDELRFGIAFYTNDGVSECPQLEEVAPAFMNFEAISELYDRLAPAHQTPTGDSLTQITNALLDDPFPGPRAIVLATDGEPDTCEQPDPNEGQEESISAARAAFSAGIRTHVIAVGLDISLQHLQDLANAGAGVVPPEPDGDSDTDGGSDTDGSSSSSGGDDGTGTDTGADSDDTDGGESSDSGAEPPVEDAKYYVTEDRAGLAAAFQEIIGEVRPCSYSLAESVIPGRGTGTVTLDGEVLPFNRVHGWRLNGAHEIELLGNACAAALAGPVEVSAQFDCAAFGEE